MKFYDQFVNRPPTGEEINSGEEIVEKAGYVPAEIQIMEMINAGERLGDYRKERYDYGEGDQDDGMMDPTRAPGVDMADISQMKISLDAKIERGMEEIKENEKMKNKDNKEQEKEGKENGTD